MRPVVTLVLSAALALTLQPAVAQSPGAATMPPGTQNPALVQPRLVPAPGGPLAPTAPQPSGYQPGPQPGSYQPGPQPSGYQPGPQPSSYQPGPQPTSAPAAPQPGGVQPGPQPGGYPPAPQPSSFQPGPPPGGYQPGPTPDSPSAGTLDVPGGAAGLCECLINHDPSLSVFDKTKMHQSCLGSVAACQAACQTDHYYSFVPRAIYTCPLRPEKPGNLALNVQPAVRYLSRRQ